MCQLVSHRNQKIYMNHFSPVPFHLIPAQFSTKCPLPSLIILLFILLGLAPKHARQRILEVQDSRVAVCKGEEITVTATLYILLCKEKGTVFRMSLTYKRAGCRIPVWPKELEVAKYGQKNCNQRLEEERFATSSVS